MIFSCILLKEIFDKLLIKCNYNANLQIRNIENVIEFSIIYYETLEESCKEINSEYNSVPVLFTTLTISNCDCNGQLFDVTIKDSIFKKLILLVSMYKAYISFEKNDTFINCGLKDAINISLKFEDTFEIIVPPKINFEHCCIIDFEQFVKVLEFFDYEDVITLKLEDSLRIYNESTMCSVITYYTNGSKNSKTFKNPGIPKKSMGLCKVYIHENLPLILETEFSKIFII